MNNKQEGDVFFSKALGCNLVTKIMNKSGRCELCAYGTHYSNTKYGNRFKVCGILREIRQEEAGHCSYNGRQDNTQVYFQVKEAFYNVPKETVELLVEVENMTTDRDEQVNIQKVLLDSEYNKFIKEYGRRIR